MSPFARPVPTTNSNQRMINGSGPLAAKLRAQIDQIRADLQLAVVIGSSHAARTLASEWFLLEMQQQHEEVFGPLTTGCSSNFTYPPAANADRSQRLKSVLNKLTPLQTSFGSTKPMDEFVPLRRRSYVRLRPGSTCDSHKQNVAGRLSHINQAPRPAPIRLSFEQNTVRPAGTRYVKSPVSYHLACAIEDTDDADGESEDSPTESLPFKPTGPDRRTQVDCDTTFDGHLSQASGQLRHSGPRHEPDSAAWRSNFADLDMPASSLIEYNNLFLRNGLGGSELSPYYDATDSQPLPMSFDSQAHVQYRDSDGPCREFDLSSYANAYQPPRRLGRPSRSSPPAVPNHRSCASWSSSSSPESPPLISLWQGEAASGRSSPAFPPYELSSSLSGRPLGSTDARPASYSPAYEGLVSTYNKTVTDLLGRGSYFSPEILPRAFESWPRPSTPFLPRGPFCRSQLSPLSAYHLSPTYSRPGSQASVMSADFYSPLSASYPSHILEIRDDCADMPRHEQPIPLRMFRLAKYLEMNPDLDKVRGAEQIEDETKHWKDINFRWRCFEDADLRDDKRIPIECPVSPRTIGCECGCLNSTEKVAGFRMFDDYQLDQLNRMVFVDQLIEKDSDAFVSLLCRISEREEQIAAVLIEEAAAHCDRNVRCESS